jgi:cysteine desulfurase
MLDDACERLHELLGAKASLPDPDRLIFTSGGTESNNLAILGLLSDNSLQQPIHSSPAHLIVSAIEHPSVSAVADEMRRRGCEVSTLGVDGRGIIRVNDLPRLLRPETRLVVAMLGQNETGVLQPVPELATICRDHGVPLHTDAAQVVGKLPVDFRCLGASTMAVAAHKFHGPLGIGALVVRHGLDLRAQLFGGPQQGGFRPGTVPVALAVGMCRALELWHAERHERSARMRTLRDRFEKLILEGWPRAVVIGGNADRLPHTSQIAFVGLDRQVLFIALDQAGVACSAGSACASGSSETSPALLAMGCEDAILTSALRFSLGATTTAANIDEAARRILHCCNSLRRQKQR